MLHQKNKIESLNYLYVTPIKFFIKKVWNNNIINNYENGLNRLNKEFDENLEIELNLNNTLSYSGKYLDNLFNEKHFGLLSLTKITQPPFINDSSEKDKYYIQDTFENKKTLLLEKDNNSINTIESNDLYNYNLQVDGETLYNVVGDTLSSTISYQIDFLDKKYRTADPIVNSPYATTDNLQFYSDKIIKNADNISVITTEEYYVTDYNNYGIVYQIILKNKYTGSLDLTIYYNENKIMLLSYEATNNDGFSSLVLTGQEIDITKNNSIKIVDKCNIIYYKITNANITILTLSKNIESFYFTDGVAVTDIYIDIDDTISILKYDTDENNKIYYYVNRDISDGSKDKNTQYYLDKLYTIFKFNQINQVTTLSTKSADIVLNRDIGNYLYYNQTDTNLPVSFTHSNTDITINEIEYLTSNKLRIKYTGDIEDILVGTFQHKYRLKESVDYRINEIDKLDKYLYNFKNIMFFNQDIDDISIKVFNDTTTYTVEPYSINTSIIKFFVSSSSHIPTTTLNDMDVSVTQDIDMTSNLTLFQYNPALPGAIASITLYIIAPTDFRTSSDVDIGIGQNLWNTNDVIIYTYDVTLTVKMEDDTINTYKFENVYLTLLNWNAYDQKEYGYPPRQIIISAQESHISVFPDEFTQEQIQELVIHQKAQTNNYTLYEITNKTANILDVRRPNYVDDNDFVKSNKYKYYIVINNTTKMSVKNLVMVSGDIKKMEIELYEDFIYTDETIILHEKLNDLVIDDEVYNSLYKISTINDITDLNKSNIYIPQVKILDNNLDEFTPAHTYNFTFTESDSSITINFGNYIYIFSNNQLLKSQIVFILKNDSTYTVKFCLDNALDTNVFVYFYTTDFLYSKLIYLSESNLLYNTTTFVKDIDSKTIHVLCYGDAIDEYKYTENITDNMNILKLKYTTISLTNNSFNNIGFNKVPDITEKINVTETKLSDPEWIKNMPIQLFKNIQFIIDDQIIEKIDYHTYIILNTFNESVYKNFISNKLTTLKYEETSNGKFLYFYLPLSFFFTNDYSNYLPVCAMRNSNIKIKFFTNSLKALLLNDGDYTNKIKPIIDFFYTTITLSSIELNKLKKNKLIYLADVSYIYSSYLLNNATESNHINLYNMVKDLFLVIDVTKSSVTNYDRDVWYNEYNINYDNYKLWKNSDNAEYDDIQDYEILTLIDYEISTNSNRVKLIKSSNFLENYDTRFIIYLDEKYFGYINEDLNNLTSKYSIKIGLLSLYFNNIYKNEEIQSDDPVIETINLRIDGSDILPTLSSNYFNLVNAYLKGYRLLDGYYLYSFSYDSLNEQPSGHLNFKLLKDFQIYTKQNLTNVEGNIKLKIYTNEYRIIEINNNKAKLIS